MSRVKTFDATGVAPNGRLFAGDLNSIQDQYADAANFAQMVDLATLRIGDSTIQLVKYGAAEARVSAALRTDGLLRGLGGIIAGAFTTTARNAIATGAGLAPYGTIILNTTTNQYEWNKGDDTTRNWVPLGVDPAGSISLSGATSTLGFTSQTPSNYLLTARRSGDTFDRLRIREDGQIELGPGNAATDLILSRSAVGRLRIADEIILNGNSIYFVNDVSKINLYADATNFRVRAGTTMLAEITANHLKFGDNSYGVRAHDQEKLTVAYGSFTSTVASPSSDTISFGFSFAEAPWVWVAPNGGVSEPVGPGTPTLNVKNITTTSFKLLTSQTGAPVRWIAIGPIA